MSRIFYQILYVLWDACHELFCVFGDFDASGMQHAEVTKSLQGFFFYLTNAVRVPQPVVLISLPGWPYQQYISFVASIQQEADPQNLIHDANKLSFKMHDQLLSPEFWETSFF